MTFIKDVSDKLGAAVTTAAGRCGILASSVPIPGGWYNDMWMGVLDLFSVRGYRIRSHDWPQKSTVR